MDQIAPAPEPKRTWLDQETLERVMPRTLMARVSLTIVAPLLLVQIISTYAFYDNFWNSISRRMAADLAGDIANVAQSLKDFPDSAQQAKVLAVARDSLELEISFTAGEVLADGSIVDEVGDADERLEQMLWQKLQRPFIVDFFKHRTAHKFSVRVQEPGGVLTVLVPRQRIFSNNTTLVFVIWMIGSSILLFGVATVYLRSQVAAVRRLARAAEAFGKGREVPDFPAVGAFEVRQAGRAFNMMRERIQRQITQRTEMLAGVSHDLRTPLTRMKLQLAMRSGLATEGIAALREDVGEMERMLEAYLAFARGDGAEPSVRTDVAALIENVVNRFRREGADINLQSFASETHTLLKPVAFERCLNNLIGNAVRYGRKVAVTAAQIGGFIHVDVDDDGPGIPADKREDAFRAFHRLEPSRNPRTGGIGLGLTIARDVVRGMGGEIVLGDSPAGGLRATVRFPM